jgi:hypothetical protein
LPTEAGVPQGFICDGTLAAKSRKPRASLVPGIGHTWRGLWFRQGEPARLSVEASRDAGTPLTTRQIARFLMRTKGLSSGRSTAPGQNDDARGEIRRLEKRRKVRRILDEPEMWWELVG